MEEKNCSCICVLHRQLKKYRLLIRLLGWLCLLDGVVLSPATSHGRDKLGLPSRSRHKIEIGILKRRDHWDQDNHLISIVEIKNWGKWDFPLFFPEFLA